MQSNKKNQILSVDFDLLKILKSFFLLKDWKKRSLFIGLPAVASVALFAGSFGGFMILVIYDSVEYASIGIALFFLYILSLPILLLTSLSVNGYKIKQSEAVRDGVEIYRLYSIRNFFSRVKNALILHILYFAYQIVPLVFVFLGQMSIFMAAIFGDSLYLVALLLIILGYGISFIGSMIQMVIQVVLYPLVLARFINRERTTDVINYSQTWKLFRKHWTHLLLIGLVTYLMQTFILTNIYVFAFLFIAVGIIFPPLFVIILMFSLLIFVPLASIGTVYVQHVQAEMIGKLAKNIRSDL